MHPSQLEALRRFLSAERQGQESDSEAALGHLLSTAARPRPSAGFSARVLSRAARAGLLAGQRTQGVRLHWWQWASASVVAAAMLAVMVLGTFLRRPALILWGESAWSETTLAGIGMALLSGLGQLVAGAAALWRGLLDFGEVATLSLQTPGTALASLIALSLSVAAFRVLHELISRDRSSLYVQSH